MSYLENLFAKRRFKEKERKNFPVKILNRTNYKSLFCSEYVKELPILFVFGVATTVSAVHRFLPHAVSSRLSIEKFQSQPSLECLTEVIDKVK